MNDEAFKPKLDHGLVVLSRPSQPGNKTHEEHHDDEFDQRLGYDGQRSDSQLYGEREGKREYDK